MRLLLSTLIVAYSTIVARGFAQSDEFKPLPIIFDTDIGNDVDDVLALGVIHALANRGECVLLAVTITRDDPDSAAFVDAVNTFYGRGEIPIGVVRNGPAWDSSRYTSIVSERDSGKWRYPHDLLSGKDAPDAVTVLRNSLASARDASVVMVQVGTSTNLSRLLESLPDDISPLAGQELVKRKVKLLSIMAGIFEKSDGQPASEFNIASDVPAAQKIADRWPTPIVYADLELGMKITYPAKSIERDFDYVEHHPLAESYRLHSPPSHNRPAWDLISVLYAVRPDRGYFGLSQRGQVRVTANGESLFEAKVAGPHQYLTANPEQITRVREALVQLASQPPQAGSSARNGIE